MVPFPFQGQGKGIGGILPAFLQGVANHSRVHIAELFRFADRDVSQVVQSWSYLASHPQVIQSVNRLGPGHFLENLGHLRVALLQGFMRVGIVFQVCQRLANNGIP